MGKIVQGDSGDKWFVVLLWYGWVSREGEGGGGGGGSENRHINVR